jgi:hypothetical protein
MHRREEPMQGAEKQESKVLFFVVRTWSSTIVDHKDLVMSYFENVYYA